MHLTILASGSEGNAVLIETSETRVFIDAGLRGRMLGRRMQKVFAEAVDIHMPSAAFLTHEHGDHVAGAEDLAKRGLLLYATCGTARAAGLSAAARAKVRELSAGEPIRHGSLIVVPVALPHDAAEPVGYVVSDGRLKVGVLTDCGHASRDVAAGFAGCDALVLETNHDRVRLHTGPYPPSLKKRIAADTGHLSNEQSAQLLGLILRASPYGPRLVICAHLSKTNNHPDLARSALSPILGDRPVQVLVASQQQALGPIDIASIRPGATRSPGPARQLILPF